MIAAEDEIKSIFKVCLSVLASLCYTFFIASNIPKGKLRFLSFFPIIYLFTTLPLSLSTPLSAGVIALFITWVGSFKLLLFSFGLGPLSSGPPQKSLLLFIFFSCLPIKTKQDEGHPHGPDHKAPQNPSPNLEKPLKLPLNLTTKALLLSMAVVLTDYKNYVHPVLLKLLLPLYCLMLYLFVDIIVGLGNAIMRATLGVELESPSDEPYLSTSLQDFWGRRWNLMVTKIMRLTVYKPVRSATGTFLGAEWTPFPAVLASFLVSGLMHELIFYYMTRVTPTWEVTCFFVLHGVCLVVEVGVKKALTKRWQLHWVVSIPLTVGFVVATSTWLFFPPLVRNGVDTRTIEECKELLEFVKAKVQSRWSAFMADSFA